MLRNLPQPPSQSQAEMRGSEASETRAILRTLEKRLVQDLQSYLHSNLKELGLWAAQGTISPRELLNS